MVEEEPIDLDKSYPMINLEKTIAAEKLVYNKNGNYIYCYLFFTFFLMLVCMALSYIAIVDIQEEGSVMAVIIILIDIFFVLNLFYFNTVVKVKGINKLQNKEDVMNALKIFYDDLSFNASKEDILRDINRSGFSESGKIITAIFKEEEVWFSITTLGRGGVFVPVVAIFNYNKCKKISQKFLELQAKSRDLI